MPEPAGGQPGLLERTVSHLGRADIVVGIPSYNNADTIGQVVAAAHAGLAKYFPALRGLIVNSDGGSADGTPEVVLNTPPGDARLLQIGQPLDVIQRFTTAYTGLPGKGSAFRTIFQIARSLQARVCVVLDADLRSVAPEWIERLAGPILGADFDFVSPYYLRHKYDGTITNSIVYPLTRALYGKRIRQPIGGDFGFSGPLLDYYLQQDDVWTTDVARFGIDIWVTTECLCGGFRPCQAFMGAKIHAPKDPAADLSAMLMQVVGSLFFEMERRAEVWRGVRGSEPVPIFGFQFAVGTEPVLVNVQLMREIFYDGAENLLDEVWSKVLHPENVAGLRRVAEARTGALPFRLDDRLWVRTIYDFAAAYHGRTIDRSHLLRSLTPLYLGWVASFVLEIEHAGARQVEERLEQLCLAYEQDKPYLLERWDAVPAGTPARHPEQAPCLKEGNHVETG
jgi:glucosylglycerate synthase